MPRTLRLTLSLSLIFHAALAFHFYSEGRRRSLPGKKGVIAVEFIQSVSHPTAVNTGKETSVPKSTAEVVPSTPQGPVGDPQATAAESDRYLRTVTTLISNKKIYPARAIEREEEGRVVVGVTVNRQGQVINSTIEEKSPFQSLNQAALDTVQAVGQFPPLPELIDEPLHLHVPLTFKIE